MVTLKCLIGKTLAGAMGTTTCLSSSSGQSWVSGSQDPQKNKPKYTSTFQVSAHSMFANVPLDKAGHRARLDSRAEETDFSSFFFLNKFHLLMGRSVMPQAGEVFGTIIPITYHTCLFCFFLKILFSFEICRLSFFSLAGECALFNSYSSS